MAQRLPYGWNVREVPLLHFVVEEDDAEWALRLEGSCARTLYLHSVLMVAVGCTDASCLTQDNCKRWGNCGTGHCKHKAGGKVVAERAIHVDRLDMAVC